MPIGKAKAPKAPKEKKPKKEKPPKEKKLKKGKKYSFQVKAFIKNGKTFVYGKASKAKTLKVK